MQYLSHIGYARNTGPENTRFQRVGKLFYDKDKHECKVLMTGFRQGLCMAKPKQDEFHPFLQGELVYPIGMGKNMIMEYLFCGFITTAENSKHEDIYSIRFDALPVVNFQQPNSLWLEVKLEDK